MCTVKGHTHVHIYIYVYVCVHKYIYKYICICVCVPVYYNDWKYRKTDLKSVTKTSIPLVKHRYLEVRTTQVFRLYDSYRPFLQFLSNPKTLERTVRSEIYELTAEEQSTNFT